MKDAKRAQTRIPEKSGSRRLAVHLAPRIGTLAGTAIALVAVSGLLESPNLPASSIAVPLVFAGSILFFGMLSLFDGRHAPVGRPARAVLGCAALLAYACLLYLDVRYWIAITLLIVIGFVIIGRRSWLVMLLFWICTQGLAYGIFGSVLGIPIH